MHRFPRLASPLGIVRMWLLYQLALLAILILVGPFLLLKRGKHYWPTLSSRLGHYTGPAGERPLWIHAVSVGEVSVALTLIRHLPPDLPLLITTITPTGQQRAREELRDRATVAFLPFDLGPPVDAFLRRFRPNALILVEGDYWPLLLTRAKKKGLPIAVINGRIGDRSYSRMRRIRPWLAPLLQPVDRFALQTPIDRDRLLDLGIEASRATVTGNIKFDSQPSDRDPELESRIVRLAAHRPILVAGSTMEGEEEEVLEAFEQLGGADRAMLLLAPRHPERWEKVERLIAARGTSVMRRSRLSEHDSPPAVLLLDSLGELAALYGIGVGTFIGGSLVPTGGHNPLEAARFGIPVAVGPSMDNFRDIAALFDSSQAWARVADALDLSATWNSWLENPHAAADLGQRGARLVESHRGALPTTLAFLATLIPELAISPQRGARPR